MTPWFAPIITIVCSVVASGGFWAFLQSRTDKKDMTSQMLLGLGHDRLQFLCTKYIERKSITHDEFENLHKYLYLPYKALGGNGSVERLMRIVETLPITPNTH